MFLLIWKTNYNPLKTDETHKVGLIFWEFFKYIEAKCVQTNIKFKLFAQKYINLRVQIVK